MDLPEADDRAVAHGEMLGDAERAEPGHVHVVQQHPVVAVAHRRVQLDPSGQRAERLERRPEGLSGRVLVDRRLEAVSQHLKVLRDAGLVSVSARGQQRLYAVRPEGLAGLRDFLAEFWPDSLARLKQAVESADDG